MNPVRNPAQSGRFYCSEPKKLRKEVESYVNKDSKKKRALGIVSPHAGFIYSGKAAGAVFSRTKLTDTFIIIGPNHTGRGADTAIVTKGKWAMPNGNVKINTSLAESILASSKNSIKEDEDAHIYEHSIEVQLPFIQYFRKDFTIVPICMRDYHVRTCKLIGQAIAGSIKKDRRALIIASSDMSHYEPLEVAGAKDKIAINEIINLSPENLLKSVSANNISMCGSGPVAVMLFAARELGASKAELVFYNTSADVSGDNSSVVGYAGMIVS